MTEECITPLRRMIEDMSVRHFASKTKHDYIRTVMKLTRFLGRQGGLSEYLLSTPKRKFDLPLPCVNSRHQESAACLPRRPDQHRANIAWPSSRTRAMASIRSASGWLPVGSGIS